MARFVAAQASIRDLWVCTDNLCLYQCVSYFFLIFWLVKMLLKYCEVLGVYIVGTHIRTIDFNCFFTPEIQ